MPQSETLPVGLLVRHRLFGYRGVIVGCDPEFRHTDEWYDMMAKSRPPKDRPWYHVLPDGHEHRTYVAEQNLEPDTDTDQIDHPELGRFFRRFVDGRYVA